MRPRVRPAAVAGTFYPSERAALRRQIDWCFEHPIGPGKSQVAGQADQCPRVLVAPHAGYRYSGPIAAHAYRRLAERGHPELVVVIGPNHRMIGAPLAVPGCDYWQTPLGLVAVDSAAVAALRELWPAVEADDLAHLVEHSLEVQVPFLQHVTPAEIRMLPIVSHAQDYATSRDLGLALADLLQDSNAAIVATSDFTHYESHDSALARDRYALQAIEQLDAEGFMREVLHHGLSICGPGAIVSAIVAARELGAARGITLRHGTSGELSGDYDRVVGYAAISLE